jgi:Bacterial Ig-like domain
MLTNPIINKKIRFPFLWGLVFSFLLFSCSGDKKDTREVILQWDGKKAESIIIPMGLLREIPKDSIQSLLHIQLINSHSPILGEYSITDDAVVFKPLIAFTRGLKYKVLLSGKLLSEIGVPAGNKDTAPEVVSVYPTSDTVPVNLLKIYIAFSKPMQEGESVNNIAVIKNKTDTVPSVFLDLEPELWNNERTILTLWLDPGRIKRDLQPNKAMGLPLEQGVSYQIIIKTGWRDTEGDSLASAYHKVFFAGPRDSLSPNPSRWTIQPPKVGSTQPLKIKLHESLDFLLLKNAVRVVGHSGNSIEGVMEPEAAETVVNFIPSATWRSGDYSIQVESRLEDLAGNNLDRLFDKDLKKKDQSMPKRGYILSFHVQ